MATSALDILRRDVSRERRISSARGSASSAGTGVTTTASIRTSRRGPTKRDRYVQQLLRHNDAYPVRLRIRLEFEVPAAAPDELEQADADLANDPAGLDATAWRRRSTLYAFDEAQPGRDSVMSMAPSGGGAAGGKPNRLTSRSSYIHYEFTAPHDERPTKADVVVHFNGAKAFSDNEARTAGFTRLPGDQVLRAYWEHHFDMAVTPALIEELYRDGLSFKIWDTRDKVASRARFDRPRGGGQSHMHGTLQRIQEHRTPGPQERSGDPTSAANLTASAAAKLTSASALSALDLKRAPRNMASEDGSGALLWVDLSTLFGGELSTETILEDIDETGLKRLLSLRVRVSVDQPILNPEQTVLMNPLTFTVKHAGDLPRSPTPFSELDRRCRPTSLKFRFFGQQRWQSWTCDGPHGPTAVWERSFVVLTGLLDRSDFADWLVNGGGLKLQVHDRDRLPKPGWDGGIEDEDFSDYNAVGRKLKSAEQAASELWDPYGVASVDLSPIMHGVKQLQLTVPVLPCEERERAQFSETGQQQESAMHPGHYVAAGTYLDVSVSLAHARRFDVDVDMDFMLVRTGVMTDKEIRKRRAKRATMTPEPQRLPNPMSPRANMNRARPTDDKRGSFMNLRVPTATGTAVLNQRRRPFTLLVARMAPHMVGFAGKLRSAVIKCNARALNVSAHDVNELNLVLGAYVLQEWQSHDVDLDLITGFEFVLPEGRLIVLEGLLDGAMSTILNQAGWPEGATVKDMRILFNTSVTAAERRYGALGAHLQRITLDKSMHEVLTRQELYFQGHALNTCLSGLCCVQELFRLNRLAEALRCAYFPSVPSLLAIKHELAVVDEPMRMPWPPEAEAAAATVEATSQSYFSPRHRSRQKAALDMAVPVSLCEAGRSASSPNFALQNRTSIERQSQRNREIREREQAQGMIYDPLSATIRPASQPAGQHQSAPTSRPATSDQGTSQHLQRTLREEHRKSWRTKEGFNTLTGPGTGSALPAPSPASALRSAEPFDERFLNQPAVTTGRRSMPWHERHKDMQHGRPTQLFSKNDATLSVGETEEDKWLAKQQEDERWRAKLVVTDPKFHAHHPARRTSQLDRLNDLLADRPQRRSLRLSSTQFAQPISMDLHEPYHERRASALTLGDDGRAVNGPVPITDFA